MNSLRFQLQWHRLKDANGNNFTYGSMQGALKKRSSIVGLFNLKGTGS
jgi:hypothetical protein